MAIDDRRRGARRALHVSRWRGHQHVAVLTPDPEGPPPSAAEVASAVDRLRSGGCVRVLTGALQVPEVAAFRDNGFAVHDRLHLLRHDLVDLPRPRRSVRTRRGWRRDRGRVLEIDRRAFDDFWTLDRSGLEDAIRATPTSRFRVATDQADPFTSRAVTGYAVTGRAADRGYLQRLAVDPGRHRGGIGRALVADALSWLARTGARAAVVNTQERNAPALELYLSCGFVREPEGLTVLSLDLAPLPRPGPVS